MPIDEDLCQVFFEGIRGSRIRGAPPPVDLDGFPDRGLDDTDDRAHGMTHFLIGSGTPCSASMNTRPRSVTA